MPTPFTRKRSLYFLLALCCAGTIYFYPFFSSSIKWMQNPQFRYENRTPVKLPFRWISGEGGGLVLRKPSAAITFSGLWDTTLSVHDHGPDSKLTDQQRLRLLHAFSISDSGGAPKDLTYPFTSASLLCSSESKKPSDTLLIVCFSSNFRYFFEFMGREENIREASEIAKQVIQ
jgi:hypothetical protein